MRIFPKVEIQTTFVKKSYEKTNSPHLEILSSSDQKIVKFVFSYDFFTKVV
jgi:hypothetical protein